MNLTNFYRRFIKNFNKIIASLTKLLKNTNTFVKKLRRRRKFLFKFRTDISNNFFIGETARTFETLKKVFITVFVFRYFNSIKLLKIKIDVFDKIIKVILCQFDDKGYWYFIVFLFRKLILAKCNYEIYNKKLLIIVKSFKH